VLLFFDITSWTVDLFPACLARDCIRKVNLRINIGLFSVKRNILVVYVNV